MVLTLKSYAPVSKISDLPPGAIEHPGGKGLITFDIRVLTRFGEVVLDFGQLKDLLSWHDTLSTEGASGTWTLKMRATLCNEDLLKKIHPGMVIEAYCARNDDPLIGVVRDPSKIPRVNTAPEPPAVTLQRQVATTTPAETPSTASNATAKLPAAQDQAFLTKLVQVSSRLGCNPEHLLTAMFYESAGTLDPGIRGPHVPGDGQAVGLIQFMPSTAAGLGTSAGALAGMSRSQQLDYVEKYFEPFKGQLTSYYKLYATIHAGHPNANPNGSDGYRTTGQAAAEGQQRFAPKARALLQQSGYTPTASVAAAPQQNVQAVAPAVDVIGPEIQPVDDPYLDKCPYLLVRGVICDYGRSVDGNQTSLTITGESYGKIYKNAFVLTDLKSPDSQSQSFEMRVATATQPLGVSYIYYGLLRNWVEKFWGQSTGWEARTRQIPFPPNYMTRVNNEGSVWSALQYLAIEGFFHLFVDHTGAIVWEKLPWSSRSQSLIAGRCWEDLPLLDLPSWKILSWNDRLSDQGVTNFLRCVPTMQGAANSGPAEMTALIYNAGSIRQYGGPNKRELQFPIGHGQDQYYTSAPLRQQQATNATFVDLCALEAIRWYDRPVQRVGVTARGEAAWRIHLRVSIAEDWHCPDVKPGEYYISGRTHQIDINRGSWTTSMDLVRDRRNRYLGVGVGETPIVLDPKEHTEQALKANQFLKAQQFEVSSQKLQTGERGQ